MHLTDGDMKSHLNNLPTPLTWSTRRIGVMTSGGDAPGMNGFVRAVVRQAIASGCEVYAVHEGYVGLVQGGNLIRQMKWSDVRGWLSEGGTWIGSARCQSFYARSGRLKAAKNLVVAGIDALVVCGGDGSLTGADTLRAEWPGLLEELVASEELTAEQVQPFRHLNIVGAVGSIDNDVALTDATIGCYSSLDRICAAVDSIDSTASSHRRAFVVEVMGRNCGWLALMAGLSTEADYTFFPEMPPSEHWEEKMCAVVKQRRDLGKRKTIIIVAEGAHDRNLVKITASRVCELLTAMVLDTRVTTLGHVQRGGAACAYDRQLSTLQGVEAVLAVLEATPETPTPMIAIVENKIVRRPLIESVKQTQEVNKAIEHKDFQKALELRGAEFCEYYNAYMTTTVIGSPDSFLSSERRMRVAIVSVGAPAGGMNAAIRAVVMRCLSRGHTPVAIYNGFSGLSRHHNDKPVGSVREITWLAVEGWTSKGGSEIGTNRSLPSEDMPTTAHCFQLYKFDALFVVGGFEAFTAVKELYKARELYPAFRIPMILLPATISNNVPGTEYSIGADTCLNAVANYCDAIRQSASSSRRRVFVVETQGASSGYIAVMAGLSVGAFAVYTPEEGITLRMLMSDIEHLRRDFKHDHGENRAGKLILRNEAASNTYSTKLIAKMIGTEAHGRFESRFAVPGHVQQGGRPSPVDRVRAQRLVVRCIDHLEIYAGFGKDRIMEDPQSVAIIGIKGGKIVVTDIESLDTHETDWKNCRPVDESWISFKDTMEMLSGRPKVEKDVEWC